MIDADGETILQQVSPRMTPRQENGHRARDIRGNDGTPSGTTYGTDT